MLPNQWQKIELIAGTSCVVDDNEEYEYHFMIMFETEGTLHFDDAEVIVLQDDVEYPNILKNGDFEDEYGTIGEYLGCSKYFFFNPDWTNPNGSVATFSKELIDVKNGEASQKVIVESIPESSYLYFAQGVKLQSNKRIYSSFWIKPLALNSGKPRIQFMIRSRQNYNEILAFNEFELIPNEWQKIEIAGQTNTFFLSSSDNADFFINFLDTGIYYIDEAMLIQNNNDPSFENILDDIEFFLPNLIKNGGFEQSFDSNGIGVHYEYNPSWFPSNSSATMIFQAEGCDIYEGLYSQRIIIEDIPEYAYFFQNFKGEPNAIYKVSAWVKSNDEIELSFTLRNRRIYEPKISSTITKKVGKNWEKIEIIGGMGSHGGLLLETDDNFDFFIKFLSTGSLLIDNISVVDVTDVILNQRLTDQTKNSPVPKNFFGLHLNKLKHSSDANPNAHTLWPDLNFGMLRLWDSGTKWSEIEHQQGQFYLDRVNLYVDKRDIFDQSTDIIMTLGSSPQWAAANIGDNFMGLNFYTSISDIDIWEEYVTTLGEGYNQRIKYWEIWNEVEHFFKESANVDLIELSRTAYTTLKSINPEFKILSPNFTSSEAASNFLYSFKEKYPNENYPFDIFSFHAYISKKPELDIGVFYGYRNLLNNYGLNTVPIWNTEGANTTGFNWLTPLDSNERLGTVSRAYIIQWLYGVKNFNWYFYEPYISDSENWYLNGTSLSLNEEGVRFNISPAGKAYAITNSWLINKKMINKEINGGVWIITLENELGTLEYLIWSTDGISSISKETRWNGYYIYNLHNTEEYFINNQLNISSAPIFLTPNEQLLNNGKLELVINAFPKTLTLPGNLSSINQNIAN